jgi:uncharacterized membrane protein YeaQ/YmgE (transglycosylase-associated protein family)
MPLLWVVAGTLAAVMVELAARREMPGGWVGSLMAGIGGAAFGGYMVETVEMGHWLRFYSLWSFAFAFGGAMAVLSLVFALASRDPGVEPES